MFKIWSQLFLFAGFIFSSLFFYSKLTGFKFKNPKLESEKLLKYAIGSIFAGFVIGAETWINFLIYILIAVGSFYLMKKYNNKIKFSNLLLKVIISFVLSVFSFVLIAQPENYLLGNAGGVTFFSLLLLSLFAAVSSACFACYLFTYLRGEKKVFPRRKELPGEVYIFYTSILIALISFIFLMFTESVPAILFMSVSAFVFMSVFYIFALEVEREIIFSKVELLFGIAFVLLGLMIASTFALLLGLVWICFIWDKLNFGEFRKLLYRHLDMENVIAKSEKYKGKVCILAGKVKNRFEKKK